LVDLNAARAGTDRLLTEERIKIIGNNFDEWAQDFANRKPAAQRQLDLIRLAERQKEIRISSDSTQLFLLVIRFIEDVVRAYEKRTGDHFEIAHADSLPQNLYDVSGSGNRTIQFGGPARWEFVVFANQPANEEVPPTLRIIMTSAERRTGFVDLRRLTKEGKFSITGGGALPLPNASALFKEYDFNGFEEIVRNVFRQFVEAQLAQIVPPTPEGAN
jgi:hypothetical protein